MKNYLKSISLIIIASMLGCQSFKEEAKQFHKQFDLGNYKTAAAFAGNKKSKIKKIDTGNLLWSLQAGATQKAAKEYNKAVETFDESEKVIKYFNKKNEASGFANQTTAVLTNDSALDYAGEEYDGIMVNTYKAFCFIAMEDYVNAKIEFLRADERQRKAVIKYSADIAKQRKSGKSKKANVNKSLGSSSIQGMYSNLDHWQVYDDFVNPFTTYASGLFFMLTKNNNLAIEFLKKAHGILPRNKYIRNDFEQAHKGTPNNTVWVIFENGLGMRREEKRIDIPIVIPDAPISYAGIALPVLKETPRPFNYLKINNGKKTVSTQLAGSIDSVVKTEFKNDFTGILTRAILSTAIKTATQAQMKKNGGQYAELIGAIAGGIQKMSTSADLRIWSALPKEFQVAKIAKPKNNLLWIQAENSMKMEVNIPKCNNAIVYIKIPTIYAKPLIEVYSFK